LGTSILSTRPPPRSGMYEVPESGSRIAQEPGRFLRQDILLAIADQASASFDVRGAGDGKSNGMSPHMARIAARYRRVAL